jgi:hypothetical protein
LRLVAGISVTAKTATAYDSSSFGLIESGNDDAESRRKRVNDIVKENVNVVLKNAFGNVNSNLLRRFKTAQSCRRRSLDHKLLARIRRVVTQETSFLNLFAIVQDVTNR